MLTCVKIDFSSPLIPVAEEESFELYRDVRRRYEKVAVWKGKQPEKQTREVVVVRRPVAAVNVGQSERAGNGNGNNADGEEEKPVNVPWDVKDEEYRLLKKASCDPSVRLVDMRGY